MNIFAIIKKKVFIIAEAGVNHNGDLKLAKNLVDVAKESGADAVKFQSFRAERLVSIDTPKVEYQKSLTNKKESHYQMIKKLEISEEFQKKLFDYCKKKDILFISTSYDVESAKFLNRLGVRVFKIASADIIDIPLHEYVASTKKPTIISVGMATLDEIKKTLNIYRKYKNRNAILLHCTSNYPASYKSLNLKVINTLQKEFDILVGYSDHSLKNYAGIISTALGSRVIEKHFTLDRAMPGPDHKASMEPDELKEFIKDIRLTELILGNGKKTVQLEEKSMKQISRKSLVANEEIKKGQIIKKEMLTLKRPGTGLKWEERKQIIGKRARKNISKDQLITINLTK